MNQPRKLPKVKFVVDKPKPKQLERKLQTSCINYFRLQYPQYLIYAIPNGGSRNVIEAANLKREGVLAGVADVHIPVRSGKYFSFFIEFKVGKNSQTPAQKEFQNKVTVFGNKYEVCRSFDEFKKMVDAYIETASYEY